MQTLNVNVDTMDLSLDDQINNVPSILIYAGALITKQAEDEIKTLDDAMGLLFTRFGGDRNWALTRGGHHIALGLKCEHGGFVRVLLVTEL